MTPLAVWGQHWAHLGIFFNPNVPKWPGVPIFSWWIHPTNPLGQSRALGVGSGSGFCGLHTCPPQGRLKPVWPLMPLAGRVAAIV